MGKKETKYLRVILIFLIVEVISNMITTHMTRISTLLLCFFCCFVLCFVSIQAQDVASRNPTEKTKLASWFSATFSFLKKKQVLQHKDEAVAQEYLWQRAVAEPVVLLGYASFLPYAKIPRPLAVPDEGVGGGYLEGEVEETEGEAEEVDRPIERNREFFLDNAWLASYESIKGSKKLNPYDLDLKDFEDTVSVLLAAPDRFLPWHSPLEEMVVTSDFGMRRYRWHYGVDIRLRWGQPVRNVSYGVVRLAQYQRNGFGHYIVVTHHNGLETVYAHLSKRLVKPGDMVNAGEIIGLGGSSGRSSGPHLHFEVRYKGWAIDPNALIDFSEARLRAATYRLTKEDFSYLKKANSVLTHRIRRGDGLIKIARRYGTTVTKLCRLNGISRRSVLRIGRKLRIR